jgi:type I restriction enzyme S subunit
MSASITNSEKVLVPEIRFKGFDDYWEKYRMEQLADCYDGTHQTPKYVASGVPFVSVENVKSYATKSKFITKEAFDKNFKTKPKKGDVIMTRITAGIIGMTSIVENDDDLAYYVSVALIRKKKDIGSSFLAHRIESEGFKRELHKRIIHVAFPKKINLGDLQKCVTFTPSLPEQQKIASFLSAIDDKVQQLTKKKELLEQYKKGVMQQLFTGQLRFKAEDGNDYPDWEEKRLGDLIKLQGGNAFKSLQFKKEGIPIIRISNISNKTKYLDLEKLVHYDEQIKDANYIIEQGDLLIAMSGATTGKSSISDFEGKAYLNQRVGLFKSITNELEYGFLIQFVFSDLFSNQLDGVLVAGAQPNISSKDIENFKLNFPCLEEQQKIATYLSGIDTKIESVNTQITQTQTFKKGLLQLMFV